MTKKILSLILLVSLTACTSARRKKDEQAQQQKRNSYAETYCNYNAAFRRGYNDAQTDKPMSVDLESNCDPSVRTQVSTGYMDGYQAYVKAKPMELNVGTTGQQTQVTGWTCLESYGKKECGFDCKQAYGIIKCAKSANHNCIENAGNIFCGLNCGLQNNQVTCQEGPY